jgi:integrase
MPSRDIPIFRRPKATGVWYLRRSIPNGIRRFFPNGHGGFLTEKSPISLGTRDERAARKAAAAPLAEWRLEIDRLERGTPQMAELRRHVRGVFDQAAQDDLAALAGKRSRVAELEESLARAKLELEIAESVGAASRADAFRLDGKKRATTRTQRDLLQAIHDRDAYASDLRAIPDALADPDYQEVIDQYAGEIEPRLKASVPADAVRGMIAEQALSAYREGGDPIRASKRLNTTSLTPSATVSAYFRDYYAKGRGIRQARDQKGISPAYMGKASQAVDDFVDIVGDLHIAAVTEEHIREFRSILRRSPTQWRKRASNAGKSLRQLVEEADAQAGKTGQPVPRLTPATIQSVLGCVRGVFEFARDEGHIAADPAKDVGEEVQSERSYETAFTTADLTTLFGSPWFTGCAAEKRPGLGKPGPLLIRDHRYWAFLTMLFTGARVAEIGGIRADQVHVLTDASTGQGWGYFEFDWTDGEEGRRVKNSTSVRCVPIHAELIKLGFLDYVKTIKVEGHQRLFPGWTPNKKLKGEFESLEYSSADFLKTFRRYLDDLGIKRQGISPKSFRASWETATLGSGLDDRALKVVTGRSLGGGSLGRYVARTRAEQLRATIDSVTYDGLDLSDLYPPITEV